MLRGNRVFIGLIMLSLFSSHPSHFRSGLKLVQDLLGDVLVLEATV